MSNDRIGAAVSALVQAGLISVFRGPAGQPLVRLTAHASVRGLLRQEVLREFPVGVERMLTPEQLAETMQEIALGTRKEVISVLAGPAPTPEMLADSQDRDVELVQRLVKVRLLYPVEHAELEHVARYAEELAEAGAEVRFADRLPHRLLVFDQRVAVAPLDYSDSGHGAMVVREPILARSLGHLAATCSGAVDDWKKRSRATTIRRGHRPSTDGS